MPVANQSIKYLFGSAFRAPTAYERNERTSARAARLRLSRSKTHELLWERLRATGCARRCRGTGRRQPVDHTVEDPAAPIDTTYVNAGQVHATGLELEAQMGLGRLQGVVSTPCSGPLNRNAGPTTTLRPTGQVSAEHPRPAWSLIHLDGTPGGQRPQDGGRQHPGRGGGRQRDGAGAARAVVRVHR